MTTILHDLYRARKIELTYTELEKEIELKQEKMDLVETITSIFCA